MTKRFGPVRAVGPVDLEAEANRTTVLIGPSGCGKSTVLRVMIGLTAPDQGDIAFDRPTHRRCATAWGMSFRAVDCFRI